jgi:hypothetical protein
MTLTGHGGSHQSAVGADDGNVCWDERTRIPALPYIPMLGFGYASSQPRTSSRLAGFPPQLAGYVTHIRTSHMHPDNTVLRSSKLAQL